MTRKQLFEWVKEEYDTDPDYPWQDWNAVLRHKDSRKWYGLVMEIERSKLGLPGDGVVDALNVKCDPRISGSLLGQPGYFRAYHMNKEQWITILLDDTVPENQVQELVRLSYEVTRQRRGKTR